MGTKGKMKSIWIILAWTDSGLIAYNCLQLIILTYTGGKSIYYFHFIIKSTIELCIIMSPVE